MINAKQPNPQAGSQTVSARRRSCCIHAAVLPDRLRRRRVFHLARGQFDPSAARALLLGTGHPATAVWAYSGTVPGPVLRLPQGEPSRAVVENRLSEPTTEHWHGVRLRNAMEGVPDLTQAAMPPGASFTYDFTPPDAGIYWYHPHADSLQQLGRGLAGALIIEDREPIQVDRELLWVLSDWRLNAEGQLAAEFGNAMEAAMAGRIAVRAGERVRLRLSNTALARIIALRFEQHRVRIIALDGQPVVEPFDPENGRLLLGPAMRADLIIDMSGEPGRSYAVTDSFYGEDFTYTLVRLAYQTAPRLRDKPLDASIRLPANPVPESDLRTRTVMR